MVARRNGSDLGWGQQQVSHVWISPIHFGRKPAESQTDARATLTSDSKPNHRREVITAKSVLRGIEKRRHARAETAREKVLRMLAALDTIMSRLPEDAAASDLAEIERIVNTLRTADQSLSRGVTSSGMQSLDLARARIDRLADRLRDDAPF